MLLAPAREGEGDGNGQMVGEVDARKGALPARGSPNRGFEQLLSRHTAGVSEKKSDSGSDSPLALAFSVLDTEGSHLQGCENWLWGTKQL